MSEATIHQAGAMREDGTQPCARCGYLVSDYRNTMAPEGTPLLRGWELGASIEVVEGNPRYSGVVTGAPTCKRSAPMWAKTLRDGTTVAGHFYAMTYPTTREIANLLESQHAALVLAEAALAVAADNIRHTRCQDDDATRCPGCGAESQAETALAAIRERLR